MNIIFKVIKGIFGFFLGVVKFIVSPILVGLVVLAGLVIFGFYYFGGSDVAYSPDCVDVSLNGSIDAWNNTVTHEELAGINYGEYEFSGIELFGYDILGSLRCNIGDEEGQNVNYCYLDKRIRVMKIDGAGNILDDRKIGLIFDSQNSLIGAYC